MAGDFFLVRAPFEVVDYFISVKYVGQFEGRGPPPTRVRAGGRIESNAERGRAWREGAAPVLVHKIKAVCCLPFGGILPSAARARLRADT